MECARWTCLQSRTSNTLFGLRKAWGRAVTKGWSKMQWDERSRSRHMRVADRLQKLKRRSRGQSEQSDLILSQIWKQSMRCSTRLKENIPPAQVLGGLRRTPNPPHSGVGWAGETPLRPEVITLLSPKWHRWFVLSKVEIMMQYSRSDHQKIKYKNIFI